MTDDLWAEIDAIFEAAHLNVPDQQDGEISRYDLMDRFGMTENQARQRMNLLEKQGWKRKSARRRQTGKICAVVYKP